MDIRVLKRIRELLRRNSAKVFRNLEIRSAIVNGVTEIGCTTVYLKHSTLQRLKVLV